LIAHVQKHRGNLFALVPVCPGVDAEYHAAMRCKQMIDRALPADRTDFVGVWRQ
jgi:hypothetical protein